MLLVGFLSNRFFDNVAISLCFGKTDRKEAKWMSKRFDNNK